MDASKYKDYVLVLLFIKYVSDKYANEAFTPGPKSKSIGSLMAGFKSSVTEQINTIRKTPGNSVWQRNYYGHIIRNADEYNRITEHMATIFSDMDDEIIALEIKLTKARQGMMQELLTGRVRLV